MTERAHGIMFHHFYDDHHPKGQGAISADELRALLEHVGIDRILSAETWLERANAGELQPKDLCLTFDDNLSCQYDVAFPVLKDLGLTAFWFVYTAPLCGEDAPLEIYRYFRTKYFNSPDEFYSAFTDEVRESSYGNEVEKALADFDPASYQSKFTFYTDTDRIFRYSRDVLLGQEAYYGLMEDMIHRSSASREEMARDLWIQPPKIKELVREGHIVGLHSHTHPTLLESLSPADQKKEYQRNAEELNAIVGAPPISMSHPCNSYNQDTLPILEDLGIQIGFRANMEPGYTSPYEYPRRDHIDIIKELH